MRGGVAGRGSFKSACREHGTQPGRRYGRAPPALPQPQPIHFIISTKRSIYLDLQEGYLEGSTDVLLKLVNHCDVFLPSEVEATVLTGHDDLAAAAAIFHAQGPKIVVIKTADKGCLLSAGDRLEVISAMPVSNNRNHGCGRFVLRRICGGAFVLRRPFTRRPSRRRRRLHFL